MSEPTPEQVAGEEPSDKIVIYWEREYSTAIAPERLKLDFMPHRPLLSGMPLNEQRTVAVEDYKVIPGDCGPIESSGPPRVAHSLSRRLQDSPDSRWG